MVQVKVNVSNAAAEFESVRESFWIQRVGNLKGHEYLRILKSGKVEVTSEKGKAASFKNVSALAEAILTASVSIESKEKVLKSYKKITKRFKEKKLSWLSSLFFSETKKEQIETAKKIIKLARKEIRKSKRVNNLRKAAAKTELDEKL